MVKLYNHYDIAGPTVGVGSAPLCAYAVNIFGKIITLQFCTCVFTHNNPNSDVCGSVHLGNMFYSNPTGCTIFFFLAKFLALDVSDVICIHHHCTQQLWS
jgi:hypothetical protein